MSSLKKNALRKKMFLQPAVILLLIMAGALSLFTSCGQGGQQQEEATDTAGVIESQIMSLHDTTMSKITPLRRASSQLKKIKDSLHLSRPDLDTTIRRLDDADSAMFAWMQNFDPDKVAGDSAKHIQYLEEQLLQVRQVKDNMEQAIDSANALLEGLPGK